MQNSFKIFRNKLKEKLKLQKANHLKKNINVSFPRKNHRDHVTKEYNTTGVTIYDLLLIVTRIKNLSKYSISYPIVD